jgi:ABC-type phosphate/phosphonate transport system substrate-binding protein
MPARIANARMYSVAPGAAAAWRRLFEWVGSESGVPLEIIDHAFPAKLEELWERTDLAATFICGLPFAKDPRALVPVAAPIPAAPRYGGKPVYFTDFVVKAESPFRTLADTFGHRLAYTIPSSHSGYNAVRHHLLRYRTPERPRLYAETVGPVFTPRRALEALVAGATDVAPLDSYAHDLLRIYEPEMAGQVRIVESTDPFPIPLLMASPASDPEQAAQLARTFARVPLELCRPLALAGFSRVEAKTYAGMPETEERAAKAGYPVLA